ncbi:hypothetical protein C0J52_09644 [Blattella germanica]|nr:hypothetical protein C0J52_09644 [Blattella germanica]
MLPDLSGSILPPDLFGSALANFSGLFDNSSYIVPTLTSSKYNITELSEYPSSSSSVLPKVPNATTTIGSLFLDDDNASLNCSNDYCISNEDYINLIEAHIFPTTYEWVLIALHSVVFLAGLIGNALVCVAVYRNHSMRTVTNYFIVNLAVADFMVILFCLPPTVVWDVTETWFMGTALCKIVLYFQVGSRKQSLFIR